MATDVFPHEWRESGFRAAGPTCHPLDALDALVRAAVEAERVTSPRFGLELRREHIQRPPRRSMLSLHLSRRDLVVAALVAAAPGAGFALASPVAGGLRKSPEFQQILARGELIVAMLRTDSPPFFTVRDGRLAGVDVDLAQQIGRSLGVPVRFDRSAASFNDVVGVVSRGEADLAISKISRTLARSQSVRFSDPYLRLHHALLLNRLAFARLAGGRDTSEAVRDFSGVLGVIANSSFADFAPANFPRATIRPYADWDALVAAVQRGEVAGAYRDEFEVKRLLTERPTAALTLRSVTLKDREDAIGIAVGADAPTLLAYVNLFLSTRPARLDIATVLKALALSPASGAARS